MFQLSLYFLLNNLSRTPPLWPKDGTCYNLICFVKIIALALFEGAEIYDYKGEFKINILRSKRMIKTSGSKPSPKTFIGHQKITSYK